MLNYVQISKSSISVSADMERIISEYYRYRPIQKFNLLVIIGIGRYEKMLIDRTLYESRMKNIKVSFIAVVKFFLFLPYS